MEGSADVIRDTGQASAALPAQQPSAWMPLEILVTACTAFMHEDRCRLAVLLLRPHQHAKVCCYCQKRMQLYRAVNFHIQVCMMVRKCAGLP